MIYTTGTIAINGNTVTGTGTNFTAPLSLIRVGCTLIAIGNPVQIFTITEIKSGTELSVTPAANPAIAAGTKFSILLSDSISVDGLAQDVAETLRYYQSKETEVAEALEWSQEHIADKIGLGADRRDWPDCNDPTEYIGFCRAEESKAKNFPSVASGELYLVGWLSRGDGSVICGCFVGTVTRSLYTYKYNNSDKSVGWTRHARKDEVDRFSQIGNDQTRIYAGNGKTYLEIGNDRSWGVYNSETGQWKPLDIVQGGTGASDAATAREKLGLSKNNDLQLRNLKLIRNSDGTTGWVAGGILASELLSSSGGQRVYAAFYPETNVTSPSQATITISTPTEGAKYFSFNTKGQILAESAIFRATYGNPLIINSTTPTISFQENDRPEGSPYYNFVVDGGNWRIQKNGDGYNGEYVIGYNYNFDEIEVPKLLARVIQKPRDLDQTKANMLIPYTGMGKWVDYNAPEGAEAGKYYPVIIKQPSHFNGDFLTEIAMRTKSLSGSEEPNCNALHVWVRSAGWSDMGSAAFGHYFCYAQNENAILCVRGTGKGNYEYNAIYVRGDAFPVRLSATVGSTVIVPTADWSPATEPNSPTYKWGITNSSDGIGTETYGITNNLLDFTYCLSGFYCSDAFRNKYGDSYLVVQANGIVTPPNGLGLFSDQDWNAQQSDGVNKFKVIAGNVNTPESGVTYGGFHVGFSGSHVTQFAGRNSKFYARSFEAGVDKGWHQLATLDTPNIWTNTNKFCGHYIVDSSYTRFMWHIPYASAAANIHIVTWGDSSTPLNYEVKAVDTSSSESALKTLFTAKYLSDGSATLAVEGNITCTTVTQSSDRDLKDNIQVIGDATEAIRKMNGYTYTLKENGLPYAGVIAQEVMEALPEAVGSFTHYGEALQGPTTDGNELREETRYLNVDYAAVTGLLVQVARETDNRVTELEEENASLRANMAVMDERIAKLEALVRQLTGSEE